MTILLCVLFCYQFRITRERVFEEMLTFLLKNHRGLVCLTWKALASMPAEFSLFFLRLIHSRLGMPLKAPSGMLLMLLPTGQKCFGHH